MVDITVRMGASADAAGILIIREAEHSDNVLMSQWIPGFLDATYQIEFVASLSRVYKEKGRYCTKTDTCYSGK